MHRVTPRSARRSASIAIVLICTVHAAAYAQTAPVSPTPQAQSNSPPQSPLTIRAGDTEVAFGGFIDATAVRRDANTGSGLGTSFGTIPFSNTLQGHMNDMQLTAQNSRLWLQLTSRTSNAELKGIVEVDFLGNTPTGVNITTNSNTLRMRLAWGSYRRGKFEFLGGQSWSLMTPNRNGLSPESAGIFIGQTVDPNNQMGVTWGRTMQFRFTAHPNDAFAVAVSAENPDQYVGSGVKLPAGFPGGEVDTGTAINDVPNHLPEIVGKVAFDSRKRNLHQHVDAAILVRNFKTYNLGTDTAFTATATGGAISAVIEPVKTVRVIGTGFWSSGGGRYIANTNLPDFIVNADSSMTLVASRTFLIGTEIQATAKDAVYAYYGSAHADQKVVNDADGTPIGFGIAGSTAANEKVSEATGGIAHTFFRDPKIGGIQLMVQYSHVRRAPFSVPAGTPTSASVNMLYLNFRYFLP